MGSVPGLIVWRGGSGEIRTRNIMWCGGRCRIRTRTDCVTWWQSWEENQDLLCGVVAVVASEPGLPVWRGGSQGIRTRTDCVALW